MVSMEPRLASNSPFLLPYLSETTGVCRLTHCSCHFFSSRRSRSLEGCYKFMSLHLQFLKLHVVKLFHTIYFSKTVRLLMFRVMRWGFWCFWQLLCLLLVYFYLCRFYASDVKCPQNKNRSGPRVSDGVGVSLQAQGWGCVMGVQGGPAAQAEAAVCLGWEGTLVNTSESLYPWLLQIGPDTVCLCLCVSVGLSQPCSCPSCCPAGQFWSFYSLMVLVPRTRPGVTEQASPSTEGFLVSLNLPSVHRKSTWCHQGS